MKCGFTLIELLIVLAILGIAAAVVVPQMGSTERTQVSLAAKDVLRLMRYARNMALQTQQPIYVTFASGKIVLSVAYDSSSAVPEAERSSVQNRDEQVATAEDGAGETQQRAKGSTVQAGDIDFIGLTKYYEVVDFAVLGYDDLVTQGREASGGAPADFRRRLSEKDLTQAIVSPRVVKQEGESVGFTVTVRANGTTRPFSLRIYPQGAEDDAVGDCVSFDFLCAGTIEGR